MSDSLGLALQGVESHQTYGCWEQNVGPLKEECMLLAAESSLQPHNSVFLNIYKNLCTNTYE